MPNMSMFVWDWESEPVHAAAGRSAATHAVCHNLQPSRHLPLPFPRHITHHLPVSFQLGESGEKNLLTPFICMKDSILNKKREHYCRYPQSSV